LPVNGDGEVSGNIGLTQRFADQKYIRAIVFDQQQTEHR
jgi:hypothetical protein